MSLSLRTFRFQVLPDLLEMSTRVPLITCLLCLDDETQSPSIKPPQLGLRHWSRSNLS